MPPSVAVVARDLTKRYRDLEAVRSISFDVPAETCFGFLGPNGAGKTTTMRMISCALPPTSGRLDVLGIPVNEHPRRVKSVAEGHDVRRCRLLTLSGLSRPSNNTLRKVIRPDLAACELPGSGSALCYAGRSSVASSAALSSTRSRYGLSSWIAQNSVHIIPRLANT